MNSAQANIRKSIDWLYPEIEPFKSSTLKVSDLHTIYYEECGNPKGKPVVFLHGGPGGGISATHRRFFDPQKYRIVLFDQRGCGKSTPHASLEENTTWDLVSDVEKLREHLDIAKWQVFGGSWGSTLALAYAVKHSDRVSELVLRGIFTLRKRELDWFYQDGASKIYPDAYEPYRDAIPEDERENMVAAYYKRLTSDDKEAQLAAAKAWTTWEASTSTLIQDQKMIESMEEDKFATAFARIECHYFINKGFMESDEWLMENASKLDAIPTVIVHGRHDAVCAFENAWDLHKKMPSAKLVIIEDAGHSAMEAGIARALVAATDEFARI